MIRVQIQDFFEVGIPKEQGDLRERALVNLRWVLNCWASAINDAYSRSAPRRIETHFKIEKICGELRPHLTENEWCQLRKALVDENTGKAFDLNP